VLIFAKPCLRMRTSAGVWWTPPCAAMGSSRAGWIEALHTVQEAFRHLDDCRCGTSPTSLRVPLSRAYGVATFYHFFTLKPAGNTPA